MNIEEQLQQEHYDSIIYEYEAHYNDIYSNLYRKEFIIPPLFDGIDLPGTLVLDAMCGAGGTAEFLIERGAIVIGIDMSFHTASIFRKNVQDASCVCASVLKLPFRSEQFKSVFIVGGLHHLHPYVPNALEELSRVIEPGGFLGVMEPHAGSFPDYLRKFWYKLDSLFESNERAIDFHQLSQTLSSKFEHSTITYVGGLAYIFVLNSMILRMPLAIKKVYSPFLLWIERISMVWRSKKLSCVAVAQFRKKNKNLDINFYEL